MHVIVGSVPDVTVLLLAIAGLSYLMPGVIRKLEAKKGVRVLAFLLFVFFGIAAVVLNAINREEQSAQTNSDGAKLQTVMSSVIKIQGDLAKSSNMSEADRRSHLIASLRDEFVLSHNPIDADILDGRELPPASWMNSRLEQLGEHWTISQTAQTHTTVIVPRAPEPKSPSLAQIVFSIFSHDATAEKPILSADVVPVDGVYTISVTAAARGSVPAKNVVLWLRKCSGCLWASPLPAFFDPENPDMPDDRVLRVPEMFPNAFIFPKIEISLKARPFPKEDLAVLGGYYTCDNCPPPDWSKPQTLVARSAKTFRAHLPSISSTPGKFSPQ